MNLLYALHYYDIATIPLTIAHKANYIQKILKIMGIANNKVPIILIGIGSYKNEYRVAQSHRKNWKVYTQYEICKIILLYISTIIILPHIILLWTFVLTNINGGKIREDINHYRKRKNLKYGLTLSFTYLMLIFPEFRNIFYRRIGKFWGYLLFWIRPLSTLHIWTPSSKIGGGLYIGHGWGTVVNASSIGRNCLVGQNCTIGSRNCKEPIIEDDVCIWAHSVVLGDITVGKGSQIGAGSVVVKSVPPNSVVVPSKSYIIRQDGKPTSIVL